MAHTLVAVFNSIWLLIMLKYANKFMLWLMPPLQEEKPFGPIYISESLLDTPEIALAQTRKEIVRESEIALEMFREAITVISENNIRLCESLCLKDVRLDTLHNAVVPYLTKLGQGTLDDDQSKEQTSLLYVTSQIEEIGDIVDKNLMPLARKRIENNLRFSKEGWNDIVSLHGRVLNMLEKLVDAFRNNDKELAQLVANSKIAIGAYESELRKKHIARLNSGLVETLETSSIHLDIIDQFKRINSHIVSVAYIILGEI
ncbi:MAG: PhoU domain protein [Elusimicrobia bacterium ADurb.Bin231]|nr:MAG: PhoU domain protein [Elusimicrobia bacterium ADurb.Bin231]